MQSHCQARAGGIAQLGTLPIGEHLPFGGLGDDNPCSLRLQQRLELQRDQPVRMRLADLLPRRAPTILGWVPRIKTDDLARQGLPRRGDGQVSTNSAATAAMVRGMMPMR